MKGKGMKGKATDYGMHACMHIYIRRPSVNGVRRAMALPCVALKGYCPFFRSRIF